MTNYQEPKKTSDGRYYVKASRDDSTRIMVQLNNCVLSEGGTLQVSEGQWSKIGDIDSQNLQAANEHSETWFGKKVQEKTLEAAYVKSLVEGNMNTSKATVGGKVMTKYFDHTKTLITEEDVVDKPCDVILEFSGLWFMKKTFGPIWRLAQVRLKAPPKKLYPDEYLFDDQADEGPQEEEADEDYI